MFIDRPMSQFSIGEFRYKVNSFQEDYISKDKIREKIKELDNMKIGGEVFTTAVNFAKKILQKLLEQ